MSSDRNSDLRQWWGNVHAALVEVLYRHDPDGMGSSVGAPKDEYFDVAARLMRRLLDADVSVASEDVLRAMWPRASREFASDVHAVWARPPLSGNPGAHSRVPDTY